MTLVSTDPPSDEEAAALITRLLAQDPTAPADIALAFLPPLVKWLRDCFPRQDEHLCYTAAEDAILALIKRPMAYDPSRQALSVYLRMSARGDLLNLMRSEQRHRDRQTRLDGVEIPQFAGKYIWGSEADPAEIVVRHEELSSIAQLPTLPDSVVARLSAGEASALELLQQGERRTQFYAQVLGLAHLSKDEQQREVKRVKDRLKKRLERAEGNHE